MKPKNKTLLPKRSKYTHKQILDLTGKVNRMRIVKINPIVLGVAGLFGCISLVVPDLGLGIFIGLFILKRYG